ncbi:MAG: 9-O-acetylesterase [Armatimonadetes bacterium]|nr:9-O-acetylesterase [Armatimonadota bacterium]
MTPILLAAILAPAQDQALRLPALFSDHMVFQRRSKAHFWGWGKPGEKVTVKVGWTPKAWSTEVGPKGQWEVSVPTALAGGPYDVQVKGSKTIDLKDVMIGEVWVCSGQSNMEWPMAATDHAQEDIAGATNGRIRLFMVENKMTATPQDDCKGTWQRSTPETVKDFSAVAYFFAKELSSKLGCTVGVIDTTWGGTEAELWTSTPGLRKLPDFAARIDQAGQAEEGYRTALAKWKKDGQAKDSGYVRWSEPSFDDSGWTKLSPSGPWGQTELKDFDGVVWLRTTVDLGQEDLISGSSLDFGPIDDYDETWVNGTKVGSTDGYDIERRYPVPDRLFKPGKNVIAVRVTDFVAEGGWSRPPQIVKPGFKPIVLDDWKMNRGPSIKDIGQPPAYNAPRASLLYNAMIHPLTPFSVKGAVWYQGEANVGRAFQYRTLFPAMIEDWRRAWRSDLPFAFAQIAPFDGYGSAAAAELRDAQTSTLKLPGTGMVVTTDVTENVKDIHPRDKRSIGHRFSLWALAKVYGQTGFEYSGPMFQSAKAEGGKMRVTFSHSKGLTAKGGALKEFEVAGSDHKFYPATAEIVGNEVLAWSPQVASPVAVRMGWSTAPLPNLFNAAGLPASPFRSDDWPGLTDKAKW